MPRRNGLQSYVVAVTRSSSHIIDQRVQETRHHQLNNDAAPMKERLLLLFVNHSRAGKEVFQHISQISCSMRKAHFKRLEKGRASGNERIDRSFASKISVLQNME